MRIIHTSDWHLGQCLRCYEREDEHRFFFRQLEGLMDRLRPDALVVSGDVFHNAAPSASARRLFVEGVMQLHDASPGTVIVITAGNHDSGSRLDAERELWSRLGIHVVGGCRRESDGSFNPQQYIIEVPGGGIIVAVPYFHPSNFPQTPGEADTDSRQRAFFAGLLSEVSSRNQPVVMTAHLAVTGCDAEGHGDESYGGMLMQDLAELGAGYDYLALGHIHKPQQVSARAHYCGSPLPVNFTETYTHRVNLVTIDCHGAEPAVEHLPLKNLRDVVTLPPEGAPLDEALEALKAFSPDDGSYLRLLVDQDTPLAPDAEERARTIARGKNCRFCGVFTKPRQRHENISGAAEVMELDDFTAMQPVDIALRRFSRLHGTEMPQELRDMMNLAIRLATDPESEK